MKSSIVTVLALASLGSSALVRPIVAQEVGPLPGTLAFVVSGGYWEDGKERGGYRILVFSGGFEHVTSTVYVQWMREPQTARDPVDTVAVLATTPVAEVNKGLTWSVGAPTIIPSTSGTKATLEMVNSHMPDDPPRTCTLELGVPGHLAARCSPS